jgi:phosphoenolpyruvate synthase/pyruvate phosphate dikinase
MVIASLQTESALKHMPPQLSLDLWTDGYARLLAARGVWHDSITGYGCHPVDALADIFSQTPFVAAHLNYVEDRHIDMLAQWPITATKVFMNLGSLGKMDAYNHLPFDGIGLMRIEFLIADLVGQHPKHLLAEQRPEVFVDAIADGLIKAATAVWPRPIILRFSDLKTNEYRVLKGGAPYEPHEENPMIGWRGVSRYIHPEYQDAFRLECRAIHRVREDYGLKNVHTMLPFARTIQEVHDVAGVRIGLFELRYGRRDPAAGRPARAA